MYAVNGAEQTFPIEPTLPGQQVGAPAPSTLIGDFDSCVAYDIEDPTSLGADFAIVQFGDCAAAMQSREYGWNSDKAVHPLDSLDAGSFFEVSGSVWARDFALFPSWDRSELRHFVLIFEDNYFECLSLSVALLGYGQGSSEDGLSRLTASGFPRSPSTAGLLQLS